VIIDSHCHLNHELLRREVEAVLDRAASAGVERVVVVGYDLESSEEAVALARLHPPVYAAVAIHPHDAQSFDEAAEARLEALAQSAKVVAIGEIGLDYHYDFSPREAQFQALRSQLMLARRTGLPVIIHCREAYPDVLTVLEVEGEGKLRGVMHCWAGTDADAERTLRLGFYLGFGGVITFKNAGESRQIAASTPADRILLETDAPYLAPVPFRGKRNEPAYTRLVAEKMAEVRGCSVEEIVTLSTANAIDLFRRMPPLTG
jgi:TatD DNase family protein